LKISEEALEMFDRYRLKLYVERDSLEEVRIKLGNQMSREVERC
jgi:hypothetical protein